MDNWIGLVFALLFLFMSSLGGILQRAAQKAAEAQRKKAKEASAGRRSAATPPPTPDPIQTRVPVASAQKAPTGRPSPEDIAAEIRRVMGLDPPAEAKPAAPQLVESRPTPPPVEPERHRGHLAEELEAEKQERDRSTFSSIESRSSKLGEGIASRQLKGLLAGREEVSAGVPGKSRRRRKRRRRRALDLRYPASALVALEVLGKPLALRQQRDHFAD